MPKSLPQTDEKLTPRAEPAENEDKLYALQYMEESKWFLP